MVRIKSLNADYRFSMRPGFENEDAHWLLGHPYFTGFVNCTILVNVVQMGIDAQLSRSAWDFPSVVIGHFVTAIFALEMFVKLHILRVNYFRRIQSGPWNALDFVTTMTAILESWVVPLFFGISERPASYAVVRVFRLLRLLRVLRLVHNVPELFLVIEGMIASLRSMGWIIMLLTAFIYMFSIFCVEVVGKSGSSVYPSHDADEEALDLAEVGDFNNYLYFGTLLRALMSLFSVVLLADWNTIVRPVSAAQPVMIVVFGMIVLLTTFGFFNVIVGVIVERTTDAMTKVRTEKTRVRLEDRATMAQDIADIIFELDDDDNGSLSYQEFENAHSSDKFRSLLAGLDLPPGFSLHDLFTMLDYDGSEQLSKDELVLGMLRLIKGTHFQHQCIQHLMIAQVKAQITKAKNEIQDCVRAELQSLRAHLHRMDSFLLNKPVAEAPAVPEAFGSHEWVPQSQCQPASLATTAQDERSPQPTEISESDAQQRECRPALVAADMLVVRQNELREAASVASSARQGEIVWV